MLGCVLVAFAIGASAGIALAAFLTGRLARWPLLLLQAALGAMGCSLSTGI